MTDDRIAIEMPVRTWTGIDASMDNLHQGENEEGDPEIAAQAMAIRQAGWDQVTMVDGDWPPGDQVITIALTRSQWNLVVSGSDEEIAAYEEVGDQESADLVRLAVAAIEPHL